MMDQLGPTLIVGYHRPNKELSTFQKKHFTYDKPQDCYVCSSNNPKYQEYRFAGRDALLFLSIENEPVNAGKAKITL
ncbi:hypothetical protein TI10_13950 [Photorhabdus luminescens subsp. luminescens]|nr:hypothetical protein TI10_13950 [Photorhabdus luminescens subsp. luminescens]